MTPRERLLTTLRGGVADRVPLVLPGFDFHTRAAIAAHPDPFRREVAHRVFDEVAYRIEVPSYVNRYLVTPPQRIRSETRALPNGFSETRGVVDTPKGELTFTTQHDPVSGTEWTLEYPVKTLADVEKIASVPWEAPEDLAPPSPGGPALPGDFDRRGILATNISSPFVCVAGMMRFEQFLEWSLTERALMLELTEVCRRRILDVLVVLFSKPGIEYVWIGGSEWVTPPMASPRMYDIYVQEQERSLIEYVHAQALPPISPPSGGIKGGPVVHVHCHGHVRHALVRTIERGADYTEPVEPPPDGDITLAEAKALADGRITLGGNVECRVLCNEEKPEVEAAVRAAFEGGSAHHDARYRFILRPTEGPSPRMAEREFRNWMTMVDVWEELSGVRELGSMGV